MLGSMQESVSQKNIVPNRRSLEKSQASNHLESSRVGSQSQVGQQPPVVYSGKDSRLPVASQPFAPEKSMEVKRTNILMDPREESVNEQGMIASRRSL